MPAPKGYHETTSPKTGDCRQLKSRLLNREVGKVEVKAGVTKPVVLTAGKLVADQLAQQGAHRRLQRTALLRSIEEVLITTGYASEDARRLAPQVLCYLVDRRFAQRLTKASPTVYRLDLPVMD